MKGTQKALMIVGEVVSLLAVFTYGFFLFTLISASSGTPEESYFYVLIYFLIAAMVNCVFAIIGRRTNNKALLILNMITSIFSLVFFNGIGAEWGLRARKRELQNQSKE